MRETIHRNKLERWLLCVLYVVSAVALADWAIYVEISYEASGLQTPFLFFCMTAIVLLYGVAAVVILFSENNGLRIGLFACFCAVILALAALTFAPSHIPADNTSGEISRYAATALAVVSTGVTVALWKQQRLRIS